MGGLSLRARPARPVVAELRGWPMAPGGSPRHRPPWASPPVPGARPGHCFCTSSELKIHCCPLLGKKSELSIQVCGRGSPGSRVMKPLLLVANK